MQRVIFIFSLICLILIQFVLQVIFGCEKSKDRPSLIKSNRFYYVSTKGNDLNAGTFDQPWATWQKAFLMAGPGDTVYIRGGIYKAKPHSTYGVHVSGKRGTKALPICIFNYMNETPVLDCSTITRLENNKGISLYDCKFYHLKGLTVTGVSQHKEDMEVFGFGFKKGGGHIIERCVAHSNDGPGFLGHSLDTMYILRCDAYDNFDKFTGGYSGGQADGFVFCFTSNMSFTHLIDCRAWYNSDDGFDCWENDGTVIFDNCWAFNNGRAQGDGGGFKLGRTIMPPLQQTQRFVRNCTASNNRYVGFLQNGANVIMELYNNIAFENDKTGFSIAQFENVIVARNNISYKNDWPAYFIKENNDHNTWNTNLDVKVSDSDFISIDSTGVSGKRQADGSLPILDFLRLDEGSDLQDAGINVGLPYDGLAPDLGPYYKK